VCAGRTLDAAWVEQARAELERLTRQAELLEQAHQTERDSRRALRERSPAMPAALSANLANARIDTAAARLAWQHWDELLRSDDPQTIADTTLEAFDALVATVEPVRLAARKELERRQQAWRPLADQIRAWVAEAAESRRAAEMFTALQKAITWLQGTSRQIRNEKLAPIATRATKIWNTLRQESNVELGAIRLAGAGTTRRVDLDVTVDGVAGAALGVMSQGELHSLALALFLPRATMPESPFRFLMIDDPVQSMDPAKVYGLARVLAEVAQHRQVIVFTHDDRLLAAVRHLGLEAQVKSVSRLPRSQVTVEEIKNGNPADRYLDDARAIAQDEEIADQVRGTVAGNLIRHAIEYTCHEVIRGRDFRAGLSVVDTEDAIGRADSLRKLLALTLLNSVDRMGELPEALRRLDPYAPRVVATANRLAHGDYDGSPLTGLIEDARWVIERLRRR
jgi:hypothetical protein